MHKREIKFGYGEGEVMGTAVVPIGDRPGGLPRHADGELTAEIATTTTTRWGLITIQKLISNFNRRELSPTGESIAIGGLIPSRW